MSRSVIVHSPTTFCYLNSVTINPNTQRPSQTMQSSRISSTLKQKLSVLSQSIPSSPPSSSSSPAPSSPTSSTLTSPRPKFKDLIPSAWRKNVDTGGFQTPISSSDESHFSFFRMEEVVSKLIFQAGVDFETRPMIVMAACAFPDPATLSYDILLSRILSYLDLYVESDYTLVFLAAGNHHTPSWNWVWKAYRSLSRKYRKNLKKMYIVHPSFFTKMLFSLAGSLINPKFFNKIQYCRTLSELSRHVPLTQIDIPPEVYKENLKFEERIELPVPPASSQFGVPLEELMGVYGEKGGIPRVVRDCVIYLREYGLEHTGLFRRSPSSAVLKQIKDAYDRGQMVSLETYNDPNLAAVLLKMFFRDLPQPIFPETIYPLIEQCPLPSDKDGDVACITYIRETILPALGSFSSVLVLSYVLSLLHDISVRADTNKMTSHNLAIVFSPNLVKSPNPLRDVQMCGVPGGPTMSGSNSQSVVSGANTASSSTTSAGTVGMVIKCCIEHYSEIFDEVPDRSEAIPVPNTLWRAMTSKLSRKDSTRSTRSAVDGTTTGSQRTMPSSRTRPILNGTSCLYATMGRPRSFISLEKSSASFGRRGSVRFRIASGKSDDYNNNAITAFKSSAAGVEALGVNAVGLISSSSSAD